MPGVSDLMTAEKKAGAIIAEARSARSDRMKAAKSEAKTSIDDLRRAQENEFQLLGADDTIEKEAKAIASGAENDTKVMEALFAANKGAVSQMMIKSVTDVSIKLSETRTLAGKRSSGQAVDHRHRRPGTSASVLMLLVTTTSPLASWSWPTASSPRPL